LDAEWDLPDGRRVVAEIDGAAHIEVEEWVPDQLRQNDVAIDGALVLRFPSVVVRHSPEIVIAQLRRALAPLRC
jgi:very-short-patch-repair endonuclease